VINKNRFSELTVRPHYPSRCLLEHLEITGGGSKQRKLAVDAVDFAIKNLIPRYKNFYITLNLSKLNNCFEFDDREYIIEINKKQSHDDFLTAIFHEMVHVKQYLRKQLDEYWFDTYEEYINDPNEKEAFKLQEELLEKWKLKN
tara:strand:- start:1670 stop:2101 length:432 start_codon:yes stop_codon:yes gene_type:complete